MPHPNDVRLVLTFPRGPAGQSASLEINTADTDVRLVTADLPPEIFTKLMASHVITIRSATPIQHPPVVVEPTPPPWLNVTLHATTNQYLQLPCNGQLQILETGTDGSVIHARFRRQLSDGNLDTAVEVPQASWSYSHPRSAQAPAADGTAR